MKLTTLLVLGMALSCKPTKNNSIDQRPYFETLPANADLKTRVQACNEDPEYVFDVNTELCCKKTQKIIRGRCVDMPKVRE